MHEPPTRVTDAEILSTVRAHWNPAVTSVEHLPVGFGGWHWRADVGDEPVLFVTLDQPLWHTRSTAERTYAAARTLSHQLGFIHACLPSVGGDVTVAVGRTWLSCTEWVPGASPERVGHEAVAMVEQLHRTPCPASALSWTLQVPEHLCDDLVRWVAAPWDAGPYGPVARETVRDGLDLVREGVPLVREAAATLDPRTFVTTHGEPGTHNQWRADDGRLLLLDWETLRRAPAERDLRGDLATVIDHDPAVLQVFELEWQLSEIHSYADWLRGPHRDDEDTSTVIDSLHHDLAGLRAQLEAPAWS